MNKNSLLWLSIGLLVSTLSGASTVSPAGNTLTIPHAVPIQSLHIQSLISSVRQKRVASRQLKSINSASASGESAAERQSRTNTIASTNAEIFSAIHNSRNIKQGKYQRNKPLISAAQRNNLSRLSGQNLGTGVDQSHGVEIRAYFDKMTGTPRFLKITSSQKAGQTIGAGVNNLPASSVSAFKASSQSAVSTFLENNKSLLKLASPREELHIISERVDRFGLTHYKYQQMHKGIPVFGKQMIVHTDKQKSIYLLNGDIRPTDEGPGSVPVLKPNDAIAAARKHLGIDSGSSDRVKAKSSLVFHPGKDNRLTLAFLVEVNHSVSERWQYFIDARTGHVLHRINNIQHVGSIVSASDNDSLNQQQDFNAWLEDGTYYMIDPSTPTADASNDPLNAGPNTSGDSFVYDARSGDGSSLFHSTSNSATSGWDASAVSAMVNTRVVYDYFFNTFGRKSINDNNQNLMTAIHFQSNYNNAFWNGSFMVYGDGDGVVFNSLERCLDVAGHEMTHGVIENTAALIYENQSGALNESFADVFGAMIDASNWTIGEDCTVASPGFLRDMQNPATGLSAQPTKMSEYQNLPNTEQGDNGGVHVNSGIPNRAAYLLAEGLSTEGLGSSIGRASTEKIYYRALTTYLPASSQFIDARRALIQASDDLFGAGSAESTAVALSWDIIEVIEGEVSSPSDTAPTSTDQVAGDDSMIYLFPVDGSHDDPSESFDLYRQVMDNPFTGYSAASDFGPLNVNIGIFYTKPAAVTIEGETIIFFVGVDSNVYGVTNVVNPVASDVVQITTTADIFSIAISPDSRYLAYTSTSAADNTIHILDLQESSSFDVPILPQNYQDGQSQSVDVIFYADSLAFDYTSNVIIFDALFCQSTPADTCDLSGGGYQYWSIGTLSLDTLRFYFPVQNQGPEFDLSYPVFASNNNFVITLDVQEFTDFGVFSSVMTGNLESSEVSLVKDFGLAASPFWSVPSFWGNDGYITMHVPVLTSELITAERVPIDANWLGDALQATRLNDFAVAMPVMHRQGERLLTGSLQASSLLLDFGEVDIGSSKELSLTISNNGNSDVEISEIVLSNPAFRHNGVNVLVPRQSTMTVKVVFEPVAGSATQTASLLFKTDGVTAELDVSLTGVIPSVVIPVPTVPPAPTSSSGGGGGGLPNIWFMLMFVTLLSGLRIRLSASKI